MEKILHAFFKEEKDAFRALEQLDILDENAELLLAETYVITKKLSGETTIKTSWGEPVEQIEGENLAEGLIGIAKGIPGLFGEFEKKYIFKATGKLIKGDSAMDYLQEAMLNLPVGQTVIISHVYENSVRRVDNGLLLSGGHIFRLDLEEVTRFMEERLALINGRIKAIRRMPRQEEHGLLWVSENGLFDLQDLYNTIIQRMMVKTVQQISQCQAWINYYNENLHQVNERNGIIKHLESDIRKMKKQLSHLRIRD